MRTIRVIHGETAGGRWGTLSSPGGRSLYPGGRSIANQRPPHEDRRDGTEKPLGAPGDAEDAPLHTRSSWGVYPHHPHRGRQLASPTSLTLNMGVGRGRTPCGSSGAEGGDGISPRRSGAAAGRPPRPPRPPAPYEERSFYLRAMSTLSMQNKRKERVGD